MVTNSSHQCWCSKLWNSLWSTQPTPIPSFQRPASPPPPSLLEASSPNSLDVAIRTDGFVRYAVFEFGSSKTRLEVADVSTDAIHGIYHEEYRFPFADLIKNQGFISEENMAEFLDKMESIVASALKLKPNRFIGFATEAHRRTESSKDLFEIIKNLWGFQVRIISQREEGILGFLSFHRQENTTFSESSTGVLDVGGMSKQLTVKTKDGSPIVFGYRSNLKRSRDDEISDTQADKKRGKFIELKRDFDLGTNLDKLKARMKTSPYHLHTLPLYPGRIQNDELKKHFHQYDLTDRIRNIVLLKSSDSNAMAYLSYLIENQPNTCS